MARLLLRDLTPGTNYKIQLRAVDGDSVSEWSRLFDLPTTTDIIAPDVPAWAVSNEWVVSGDTFVATWQALNFSLDQNKDFDHYELELTDDIVTVVVTTDNTSYTLTFDQNRIYFGSAKATVKARVRSVDAVGNTSAWSAQKTAVNAAPSAPASISVTGLYDSVKIDWPTVADIDVVSYKVQVSTTSSSSGFSDVYNGPDNSFVHNTTLFVTDHWYRVYAVDKFGSLSSAVTSGAVKPKSTFTLDSDPPNAPATVTVTTGFDATRQQAFLDVSWDASTSTDETEYEIRYSTDATNWEYRKVGADFTSTRIDSVNAGQSYYVSVRTWDAGMNRSAWTNAGTYPITSTADTTAPSQPEAPTASVGSQKLQVVITGNKQAGGAMEIDVAYYEVFASTTTGFTTYDSTTMIGTVQDGPAMVETFQIPAQAASGSSETWYVKVRAVDRSGNISSASPQATAAIGLIATANISDLAVTNAKIQSLAVTKLTAGTINTGDISVESKIILGTASSDGVMESYDYGTSSGTTGFSLDSDGLIIKTGTIEAAALKIQVGSNMMHPAFADFEFQSSFYTSPWPVDNATSFTATLESAQAKYGANSLRVVSTAGTNRQVFFGTSTTDYNIQVEPDTRYIMSYWVRNPNASVTALPFFKQQNTNIITGGFTTLSTIAGWTRYQTVITTNSSATSVIAAIQLDNNCDLHVDGIQVEQAFNATVTSASPYASPSRTTIDGGMVRTGEIRSNTTLTINGVTLPTWAIDVSGDAVFGNALFRGDIIVGMDDEVGVGSNIQSYNYFAGGTSGWIIRADGSAEFKSVTAGTFPGEAIEAGTMGAEVFRSNSVLTNEIVVTGSIHTKGLMGEDIGIDGAGFHVLGPYQTAITNKQLTSNVVTLTTDSVEHGFAVGNKVVITGMGTPFDGTFTIASIPTTTTFTYVATGSDVASTAATGLVQSLSTNPTMDRPTLIDFPTDGASPNIISGTLSAYTLTVSNGATLRGVNNIEAGAQLTIASAILAPKAAPVVGTTYNQKILDVTSGQTPTGIAKGHNGNYFIATQTADTAYIKEYSASTGAFVATRLTIDRSITIGLDTVTYAIQGIVYNAVSSRYHVLIKYIGGQRSLFGRYEKVRTYNTSWTELDEYQVMFDNNNDAGWIGSTLGWDFVNSRLLHCFHNGTNVVITPLTMTSGSPTANAAAVTITTANDVTEPRFVVRQNTLDGGALDRYIIKHRDYGSTTTTQNFLPYDTTPTAQTAEQWPAANTDLTRGAYYDSTAQKIYGLHTGGAVCEYQSGDSYWSGTNMTDIRWVGYSWYDSVATTHETNLSPRTKWNIVKRSAMSVTINAIPAGGSDAPDKARVYVADSDTEPTLTAPVSTLWHLRETITYPNTVTTVIPVSSPAGAQPKDNATNEFGSLTGNPGLIQSTTGNSFWKGDDTAQFYKLVLTSDTDAGTGTGNKPALRIGDVTASHLRIDGDEIIAMDNDTTQGTLQLNAGGITNTTRMIITSTTDVTTSAGNTPPLRIGNINGAHLRIDGNEIQAMAGDTGTDTLVLQGGGGALGFNGASQINMGGKTLIAWNWNITSITVNASGEANISHGLGGTPDFILLTVGSAGSNTRRYSVTAKSSTTFTVQVRNSSDNSLAASGGSYDVHWFTAR